MRMAAAAPIASELSHLLLAGNPSFDLGVPKIPGKNLEGVPNANDPVMREKLRQRFLANPDGREDLPGFLKKAAANHDWQLL